MTGDLASLQIVLCPASVAEVRALARFPVLRGDHVTLAHSVERSDFDPSWLPAAHALGSTLALTAVGECCDDRVQALLVEIAGSQLRPWDGGKLHVTVSREPWARSHEANSLVERTEPRPVSLALRGRVAWRE